MLILLSRSINLFVDASLHILTAVLTETGDDGTELSRAFLSTKLSQAQMAWSTIEREAYAVLVALKKYTVGVGYLAPKLRCILTTILSSI